MQKRLETVAEFVAIANTDELKPGECKVVEAMGREIALYNVNGVFYATDNSCQHQGGPLGEGDLNGKIVTCPWHAWEYDVTTGENTFNADCKLETLEVEIEGDKIKVRFQDS